MADLFGDEYTWVGSAENEAAGLECSRESLGLGLQWRKLGAWVA